MAEFAVSPRNQVKRVPARASYDQATIYQIIDQALVCHVGFVQDGLPSVIPANHARLDDVLLLHGAQASRLMQHVGAGHEVCVAITLVDGLVLARSVAHHSLNFRSVVLFGRGAIVDEEQEKLRALKVLTEHILPGRWDEVREPSQSELKATAVVSIPIDSASAKVRCGPPADDEEDYQLPIWAGVLPLQQGALEPVDEPGLSAGIPVPDSVLNYNR